MLVTVERDWETSESAGAGGMFQVVSITDERGNDVTKHVDQGRHFSSDQKLREELEAALGTTIEIEEE